MARFKLIAAAMALGLMAATNAHAFEFTEDRVYYDPLHLNNTVVTAWANVKAENGRRGRADSLWGWCPKYLEEAELAKSHTFAQCVYTVAKENPALFPRRFTKESDFWLKAGTVYRLPVVPKDGWVKGVNPPVTTSGVSPVISTDVMARYTAIAKAEAEAALQAAKGEIAVLRGQLSEITNDSPDALKTLDFRLAELERFVGGAESWQAETLQKELDAFKSNFDNRLTAVEKTADAALKAATTSNGPWSWTWWDLLLAIGLLLLLVALIILARAAHKRHNTAQEERREEGRKLREDELPKYATTDSVEAAAAKANEAHVRSGVALATASAAMDLHFKDYKLVGNLPSDEEFKKAKSGEIISLEFRYVGSDEKRDGEIRTVALVREDDGFRVHGVRGQRNLVKAHKANVLRTLKGAFDSNRVEGVSDSDDQTRSTAA